MNQAGADRRFFWSVAGVAMFLAALPYILGISIKPADFQFYGNSALNPTDSSVYYSYIEQGRLGKIFMADVFTTEFIRPVLWQPLWFVVGQLGNVLHVSTPLIYAFSRCAAALLLVGTLWWAGRWLWADQLQRRLALYVSVFGGGLGWLIAILRLAQEGVQNNPADLWVAEAFVFLSSLVSAHFLVVTAGMIFILVSVERMTGRDHWRQWVGPGLVTLGVLSIHPFHVLTWILLWLVLTIWRWQEKRAVPWDYIRRWSTILVIGSPILLLFVLQLWLDPLIADRARANISFSPNFGIMLLSLGFFIPLAMLGIHRWRPKNTQRQLIVSWALVTLLAMYMPISFQRRLSQGLIIPWAWLAVPALAWFWSGRRTIGKTGVGIGLVVMLGLSTITASWYIGRGYFQEFSHGPTANYFLSPEQQNMLSWMKTHVDRQDTVLSSVTSGHLMAGSLAQRVYIGHGIETLYFKRKLQEMRKFYGLPNIEKQQDFLQSRQICYVLDGPREHVYGRIQPLTAGTTVQVAWRGPTMTLYTTSPCH